MSEKKIHEFIELICRNHHPAAKAAAINELFNPAADTAAYRESITSLPPAYLKLIAVFARLIDWWTFEPLNDAD